MPRTKMPPPKIKAAKGEPVYVGKHMVVHPRVCHGELTFKGTRVPVETILIRLAQGRSISSLRKSWPEVSPEAIAEAVTMATDLLLKHSHGRNGRP